MSYRSFMLFTILASCVFLSMTGSSMAAPSFDAIYQFGDSISDTGNLIRENPIGARAFANLPYGQTIHNSTGRCSDGHLMIDYFASFFHKPLLNPYLEKGADFTHGVNFAVAGSTALDSSALQAKHIASPVTQSSLSVQLGWFQNHLNSICNSQEDCQEKLSRSLVVIETGGNDYNYALLQHKTLDEVRHMIPEVVGTIKRAAQEVISLGAKTVYIPGNFPIGCLPIYLATFATNQAAYDYGNCLKDLNTFAKQHNAHLQQAIQELEDENPGVAVVYGDYYTALGTLVQKPDSYGFEQVHSACCGSSDNEYNFELTNICGSQGAKVCDDPDQYLSWDGIHMTQHAYKLMSQWLLKRLVQKLN